MKHKLKISVADESSKNEVVTCKKKTMKKGLFKKLFGFNPDKVTITVPGDSVNEVEIQERKKRKSDVQKSGHLSN